MPPGSDISYFEVSGWFDHEVSIAGRARDPGEAVSAWAGPIPACVHGDGSAGWVSQRLTRGKRTFRAGRNSGDESPHSKRVARNSVMAQGRSFWRRAPEPPGKCRPYNRPAIAEAIRTASS